MLYYPQRESEGKGGNEGGKGRKMGGMRGKGKRKEDKGMKSNKREERVLKSTGSIVGECELPNACMAMCDLLLVKGR